MSDKYRLADKFSLISGELADPGIERDQTNFESVKLFRDRLLHGEDIPLADLPATQARELLRNYLRLHLAQDGA